MSNGKVFIISGPSGSGKDTVLKEVFKKRNDIYFSISSITRDMREGEVEGEKYHFISRAEFEQGLENNAFLEYNKYLDNYYGTPKAPIDENVTKGLDVIIEVDVNGAASIREKMPEAISVFIMPPSFEVLKKRLSGRGTETKAQIDGRMKAALDEIARAVEYDYIVVNDDLTQAVDDFLTIMRSEKLTLDQQKNLINEVLENA